MMVWLSAAVENGWGRQGGLGVGVGGRGGSGGLGAIIC